MKVLINNFPVVITAQTALRCIITPIIYMHLSNPIWSAYALSIYVYNWVLQEVANTN